jgi:hypothetical protein
MAENKNTITVKFKPEGDKALVSAINKLNRETKKLVQSQVTLVREGKRVKNTQDKLTDSQKKAAKQTRILGGTFAVLRSKMLLVNFALGLGIRQLGRLVSESSRVEAMETAFNTLSGATENSTVALTKLKDATNNTMSEFDLFQQANNAMILGVTKNSDEMAEMFDIAQRLGQALGRDTASSVESLVTGIGRQSRLMLDNIGIIVKSEEAYEAYAEKLGLTADKLSDAQKKQAFLEATMESARIKVSTLKNETITSKHAFDQLSASSSNLATAIGKSLSPLFSRLARDTASLFTNITELVNIVNHQTSSELKLAEATEKANAILKEQSEETGIAILNFGDITSKIMAFRKEAEILKTSTPFLRTFQGPAVNEFANALVKTSGLIEKIAKLQKNVNDEIKDQSVIDVQNQQLENLKRNEEEKRKAEQMQSQAFNKELEQNVIRNHQQETALKQQEILLSKIKKSKEEQLTQDLKNAALSGQSAKDAMKSVIKAESMEAVAGYISSVLKTVPFPVNLVLAAGGGAVVSGLIDKGLAQFEQGGLVGGQRHSQGGTVIEAERGEFVMSRQAVQSVGLETMNQINQGASPGLTINVSAPLVDETILDVIIPKIQQAQRQNLA